MRLITRFVAFFPSVRRDVPAGLADKCHTRFAPDLTLLRAEPYLLAVAAVEAGSITADPTTLLDIFPGTAASGRTLGRDASPCADRDSLHAIAERDAQSYNLIQAEAAAFLLESDAIGLKPFYLAEAGGGTLMASRVADLLALCPRLRAVDRVAIYELMVFRTPLAQRTLHQGIRRGLPGARYRWSPGRGLEGSMARRLSPPPVNELAFLDETTARMRDVVHTSLREKTEGADGPIGLALSGGFDSRLIAAVAIEVGMPLRAFTYGRRQNEESHSAKAIARALGLKLTNIEYSPDHSLRRLPQHLEAVEGNADLATASVANLVEADMPVGTSLMHGFLGDPLAGSFCEHLTGAEYRSSSTVIDGIIRHYSDSQADGLYDVLAPAVDLEAVRADIASAIRDDCPPHQAYLLWEFENRQRTYVGSYAPLLGDHFDTIMPFYDRHLVEVWLSVAPIGMANRTTFRRLLSRYYPELARIPHPEEPAPITPNLRWQLARFYRRLPKRMLSATLGTARSHELFLRSYRHDYIWNLGNLAAPQQRAYMLARITELRPVLRESLALELSDDYATKLANNVQALRGIFLAAEYALHTTRRDNR